MLPAIVLLWGSHGHRCVRERRLQPSHLARVLGQAQREAASAAPPTARAEALLASYRRSARRSFRPPTPPPTQRELDAQASAMTAALLQQQDAEYAAALQADEEAERAEEESRLAEEEAEAARQWAEASAQAAREAAVAAAEERAACRRKVLAERVAARAARADALPPQPAAGATAVTLAVRLRDGGRVQRRFEATARLGEVFDWVGAHVPPEIGLFTLVMSYPRRALTAEEGERVLAELGIGASATLLLEGEEDEEDEEEDEEEKEEELFVVQS